MAKAGELTPKQEAFCVAYFELGSAGAAYRLAYNAQNMTTLFVCQAASYLLGVPKVAARVDELKESAARRVVVT